MDNAPVHSLPALIRAAFPATEAAANLSAETVHVWEIRVVESAETDALLLRMLSEEERTRAERIRFLPARREFITARAWLRILVGEALGRNPNSLLITYSEYGKPQTEGLFFNVSHSHGLVLIALCLDAEVGVDVEWGGREVDVMELAEAVCSAGELATLRQYEAGEPLQQAFYQCWVRKEAFLKAMGVGLTDAVREITVSFGNAGETPVRQHGATIGVTTTLGVRNSYHRAISTLPGRAIYWLPKC